MNGLLWWLAQNTITIALAVAAVIVLCRLAPRRPAWQHLLWLVVMVKFVTPPVVVWPWAIDGLTGPWLQTTADPASGGQPSSPGEATSVDSSDVEGAKNSMLAGVDSSGPSESASLARRLEMEQLIAEALAAESPLPPDREPLPDLAAYSIATANAPPFDPAESEPGRTQFTGPLFAAWLIGGLLFAAWQLRRLGRFHALARRAVPAGPPLSDEVQAVAAALRVRAPPARLSQDIATPLVWSLVRLVLLWPARLAAGAPEQRGVIAHELAHIKRRDHWVAWLVLVAGCVWWWNPLFWFVRRRLHETAEMACDAMALGIAPEGRQQYAELLLEWSQSPSRAPAPALLGMSFGARRTFRRRFAMILSERVSSELSWPGLLLAGLLGLATVPAWTLGQERSPPDPAAAPAAHEPSDDPAAAGKAADPTTKTTTRRASAADEPAIEPAKSTRASRRAKKEDELAKLIDKLTDQLKVQEVRLRELEAERSKLIDQVQKLSDLLQTQQGTASKASYPHKKQSKQPPQGAAPSADKLPSLPGSTPPGERLPGLGLPGTSELPGRGAPGIGQPSGTSLTPPATSTKAAGGYKAAGSYGAAGSAPSTSPSPAGTAKYGPVTGPGGSAAQTAPPKGATSAKPQLAHGDSAAGAAGPRVAEGSVDVINLATAYVDAQAALDVAKAKAERTDKLRGKGYISDDEAETLRMNAVVAERKLKLLRAIGEAEVAAAMAELEAAETEYRAGTLPRSRVTAIQGRIRVLKMIMESPADTKK